jgi:hypothetical protein
MFNNLKFSASIRKLKKDDPVVQMNAVRKLEKLRDIRAVDPLLLLLKNVSNTSLKKCIIHALANLHDVRAVEHLIRLLDDKNLEIVEATAEALGELNDRRAIEPLKTAMNKYKKEHENVLRATKKYVDLGGAYADEYGMLMLGRDIVGQKEEQQNRLHISDKLAGVMDRAIRRIK